MEKFNLITYATKKNKNDISFLNEKEAKKSFQYHKSFPEYKETPLICLKKLSVELGVKKIYVKDESYRFGLNSFKVLGGSYCIANYIAKILKKNVSELTFKNLVSPEIKKKLGKIVFATATDGNHGRGIAWTANKIGQKAKIFMPKGTTQERLKNILKENADAAIYELNYDDCVRYADKYAKENNGVMVQDTSWKGYEKIPTWIMQGYLTMAYETYQSIKMNGTLPTHIFLQAGVGSFAAAMTGFFINIMKKNPPIIILVEPNKANCLFKTARINDGELHSINGDLDSIMAGLCCGEPSSIAWDILSSYVNYFLSVDDKYAAHGMRVLGNPLEDDKKIISGESGAVTLGIVHKLMTDKTLKKYKNLIGLNEQSIVLCFSTEGDTDKENYRKIVWEGKYTSN